MVDILLTKSPHNFLALHKYDLQKLQPYKTSLRDSSLWTEANEQGHGRGHDRS